MITGNPSSTDRYRYATAMALPLSLIRKLCTCGKQISERQQNQYGKCVSCVRAATLKG